jgi:hypothetical protein
VTWLKEDFSALPELVARMGRESRLLRVPRIHDHLPARQVHALLYNKKSRFRPPFCCCSYFIITPEVIIDGLRFLCERRDGAVTTLITH